MVSSLLPATNTPRTTRNHQRATINGQPAPPSTAIPAEDVVDPAPGSLSAKAVDDFLRRKIGNQIRACAAEERAKLSKALQNVKKDLLKFSGTLEELEEAYKDALRGIAPFAE